MSDNFSSNKTSANSGSTAGSGAGTTWRSGGGSASSHAYDGPHDASYDPWAQPELFRGVLTRRVFAFMIDLVVLSIPMVLAVIFIFIFGIVTLGLGWGLFWLISPATVVWPIVYYGLSLGGPHSATLGMRMMDLQMRTFSGTPGYFVLGCAHAVLFWASVSFLTPLVLLVAVLNSRRQLLHDMVLGTVVVNNSVRLQMAQPAGRNW